MRRKGAWTRGRRAAFCRLALPVLLAVLCLGLLLPGGPCQASTQEPDADYEPTLRQYYIRRAEMLTEKGPYYTWSMEDKAALDDMMYQAGYWDIHHIVPDEEDLSEEEAIALGKAAILKIHDIVFAQELDDFAVYTDFFLLGGPKDPGQHLWVLQYESPVDSKEKGTFRVEMDSPSGEVEMCQWFPGEYSGRLEASQFTQRELSSVPPAGASISEAEAARVARAAVLRQYGVSDGITEQMLRGFTVSVWLREDQNLWQVEFQSPDAEVQGAFGAYMVYISPKTGEVHGVEHGGNG